MLEDRELSTEGTKEELRERLENALKAAVDDSDDDGDDLIEDEPSDDLEFADISTDKEDQEEQEEPVKDDGSALPGTFKDMILAHPSSMERVFQKVMGEKNLHEEGEALLKYVSETLKLPFEATWKKCDKTSVPVTVNSITGWNCGLEVSAKVEGKQKTIQAVELTSKKAFPHAILTDLRSYGRQALLVGKAQCVRLVNDMNVLSEMIAEGDEEEDEEEGKKKKSKKEKKSEKTKKEKPEKTDYTAEKEIVQHWLGGYPTMSEWEEADLELYEKDVLSLDSSERRLSKLFEKLISPADEICVLHKYVSNVFESAFPLKASWDSKKVSLVSVSPTFKHRGIHFDAKYLDNEQTFRIPAEHVQLDGTPAANLTKALADYVSWKQGAILITAPILNECVQDLMAACSGVAPHPQIDIKFDFLEQLEEIDDEDAGDDAEEEGFDDVDFVSKSDPVVVQVREPTAVKRKEPEGGKQDAPAKKSKRQ